MFWNSQWQSAQLRALYTKKTEVKSSAFIPRSVVQGNFSSLFRTFARIIQSVLTALSVLYLYFISIVLTLQMF